MRNSPGGFTLIELVVAVAIIAILVSILVLWISGAMGLTKIAVCQNQLRQWGKAFQTYSQQNNGFYPHMDGLDRDNGPADWYGWVDVLPPLMHEKPWREHGIWERPKVGTIFQCPAARLAGGGYGYNPERDGFFSYAMNSCLELDENCYRAEGDGGEAMPSFLQTYRIVAPSRAILLFDQLLDPDRGYGGQRPYRDAGKYCGSYPKAFAVRHAQGGATKGGSILYCDYSVRWTETVWKDEWAEDLDCPPRDDRDWFPYPRQ